MLSKSFRATALAVVCSATVFAAQSANALAQEPQRPTTQPPTTQPQTTQPQDAASKPVTTLSGCVYQEKDVPGRSPNVAERAGVLEDYILAEVTPSQSQSTAPTGTPGAAGTSGTAKTMYKLELIDDAKLKAMVGKRVEVTGRIDAEAGDKTPTTATPTTPTDRAIGRDRVDLPEFEVASIREVSGTCPAKPAIR